MGLFSKPQSVVYSSAQSDAEKEKKDTAAAKSRLLETEGENNGSQLNSSQGRSIRKVF